MASNKELIEQATEIAAELELEIKTDGLTNKELVELVRDLKAKQTDAETVTQLDESESDADETEEAEAEDPTADEAGEGEAPAVTDETEETGDDDDEETPEEADDVFILDAGKAITTKKGIKGPGDEITPEMLAGGVEAFHKFLESGHIVAKS
jgi:hypothetical protein